MFEMQKIYYFTEGNEYTGSCSADGKQLRYRVALDRENERVLAWRWREDLCFERAKEKEEAFAPISDEGLDQIRAWLREGWREMGGDPEAT